VTVRNLHLASALTGVCSGPLELCMANLARR